MDAHVLRVPSPTRTKQTRSEPLARTMQIILLPAGPAPLGVAPAADEEKSAIHTPDGTSRARAEEFTTGTVLAGVQPPANHRNNPNCSMTFAAIRSVPSRPPPRPRRAPEVVRPVRATPAPTRSRRPTSLTPHDRLTGTTPDPGSGRASPAGANGQPTRVTGMRRSPAVGTTRSGHQRRRRNEPDPPEPVNHPESGIPAFGVPYRAGGPPPDPRRRAIHVTDRAGQASDSAHPVAADSHRTVPVAPTTEAREKTPRRDPRIDGTGHANRWRYSRNRGPQRPRDRTTVPDTRTSGPSSAEVNHRAPPPHWSRRDAATPGSSNPAAYRRNHRGPGCPPRPARHHDRLPAAPDVAGHAPPAG